MNTYLLVEMGISEELGKKPQRLLVFHLHKVLRLLIKYQDLIVMLIYKLPSKGKI